LEKITISVNFFGTVSGIKMRQNGIPVSTRMHCCLGTPVRGVYYYCR